MSNRSVIAKAAKIAAPVYEAQGWQWCGVGVPSEADIALAIAEMVQVLDDTELCTATATGRLHVERGEDGERSIFLELGYIGG